MNTKVTMDKSIGLDQKSKSLRRTIVRVLDLCGRGHVGAAFSLIEILRVLYEDVLKYDARNPKWSMRDRFILSKGHGCLALYAVLCDKGFFPEEEMWNFCKPTGLLGGHPEHKVPGVEASTGSLGHGLPIGVGMALNAKIDKADYRTFVIIGDGECNEGSVWEAAMAASKHQLNSLTVIVDYNKHQSYSTTKEVLDLEPFAQKWQAFGFSVIEADGHDIVDLKRVFSRLPDDPHKPTVVICHTIKGKGISFVENNLKWHHKNKLNNEELEALLKELE
jgi:transketolase